MGLETLPSSKHYSPVLYINNSFFIVESYNELMYMKIFTTHHYNIKAI